MGQHDEVKKFKLSFEWTNWTFGIWWGRYSKSIAAPNHFGFDLGPLQVVWTWKGRRAHGQTTSA